jgi:hypothetical protein
MICRQCGTEIADKAIVCYRCGTGTTEPVRKPATVRRRRSPVLTVVVAVVVLLAALLLARHYGLFGIQLFLVDTHGAGSILIDFCPPQCLTPV